MLLFFLFLISTICVDRKYMILISDTHIGSYNFQGDVTVALPKFLRMFTDPDTDVHTLALVGDIFDLWARNYTEPQLTLPELLKQQDYKGVNISEYVDIFLQLMKNDVNVKYIRGNHDIQVTYEDLVVSGLGDIDFYDSIWEEANFHVEHGNRFDLFCAMDPYDSILPFGYYCTRSHVEAGLKKVEGLRHPVVDDEWYDWPCKHIFEYVVPELQDAAWLYERIIGGALGESIWGEIANKKYKEYEDKNMVAGCVYNNWLDESMGRAVSKYYSLIRRNIQKFGLEYTENLVKGFCGDASWFYAQIDKDLLVQGHLHDPEISVFSKNDGGKIVYANTGAWTYSQDWLPFVRVTAPLGQNASFVELMEFEEETYKFILKSSSYVPYRDSSIRLEQKMSYSRNRNYTGVQGHEEAEYSLSKYKRKRKKKPPEGWICDEDFYGSNDGCDCGCGIPDPDCACTGLVDTCVESCCSD